MNDLAIKEILLDYQKKRDIAEENALLRKKEIYELIPKLKDIDKEITSINLKIGRSILFDNKNKDILLKECELMTNKLKQTKQDLLLSFGKDENYLDIKYECNLCRDTGYIQNSHKCNCFKQILINKAYNTSNLSSSFQKYDFNNSKLSIFSSEIIPKENISPRDNYINIYAECQSFCDKFNTDDDTNLILYGPTGTGKTFISSCIAKRLLDEGYTVLYQTAFQMFETVEEQKFNKEKTYINKEAYNSIFDCDLLIIDDLGTEFNNSFTNSEFFNILNTRLLNNKKIIISTNLTPMLLGDMYTQRIFSRIFERFKMIKFIGNDLRWGNK